MSCLEVSIINLKERRMKQTLLLFFLSVSLFCKAYSQDSASTSNTKTHFEASIKYLSRNVYLGRTDSAQVSYISPGIGFYHKSGFHLLASVSYMPNGGANRIDVATIEAGYDFTIGPKFFGGIYADRFFYNTGSFAVNAEIHTSIGMYGGYDAGFVTINGGAGYTLGSLPDIVTEAGLSRSFFADKERLEITPTAKINAGSQNYYKAYYTSGRAAKSGVAKSKGKSRGNSTATTVNTTIDGASRYILLDYEISCPFDYKIGKWELKYTPTLAIPVNPATIVNGTQIVKESLSNHFYHEVEIIYSF